MSFPTEPVDQQSHRTGTVLVAGAILCLVVAGGLLWWRYGGAVFTDLVQTTLAWCL